MRDAIDTRRAEVIRAFIACALLASTTAACGGSSVPDAAPDATIDATTDAALDAQSDVARDVALEVAVEVVTDVPLDVNMDYGMCGSPVRMCLCGCGSNATCQSACIQGDDNCAACIYTVSKTCCMPEGMAVDNCALSLPDDASNADFALHCGSQIDALNACFARQQTRDPGCMAQVRMCLGPDYPMIQCVVMM
jgi:hypothetical protein